MTSDDVGLELGGSTVYQSAPMKESDSTPPWRKGKGVIDEGMFPKVRYIGHIDHDEASPSSVDYPPLGFFLTPDPSKHFTFVLRMRFPYEVITEFAIGTFELDPIR